MSFLESWHELLNSMRPQFSAAYWKGQYHTAMRRIDEMKGEMAALASQRQTVYVVERTYSYPTFHAVCANRETAIQSIHDYAAAFGGKIDYQVDKPGFSMVYVTAPAGLHFVIHEKRLE